MTRCGGCRSRIGWPWRRSQRRCGRRRTCRGPATFNWRRGRRRGWRRTRPRTSTRAGRWRRRPLDQFAAAVAAVQREHDLNRRPADVRPPDEVKAVRQSAAEARAVLAQWAGEPAPGAVQAPAFADGRPRFRRAEGAALRGGAELASRDYAAAREADRELLRPLGVLTGRRRPLRDRAGDRSRGGDPGHPGVPPPRLRPRRATHRPGRDDRPRPVRPGAARAGDAVVGGAAQHAGGAGAGGPAARRGPADRGSRGARRPVGPGAGALHPRSQRRRPQLARPRDRRGGQGPGAARRDAAAPRPGRRRRRRRCGRRWSGWRWRRARRRRRRRTASPRSTARRGRRSRSGRRPSSASAPPCAPVAASAAEALSARLEPFEPEGAAARQVLGGSWRRRCGTSSRRALPADAAAADRAAAAAAAARQAIDAAQRELARGAGRVHLAGPARRRQVVRPRGRRFAHPLAAGLPECLPAPDGHVAGLEPRLGPHRTRRGGAAPVAGPVDAIPLRRRGAGAGAGGGQAGRRAEGGGAGLGHGVGAEWGRLRTREVEELNAPLRETDAPGYEKACSYTSNRSANRPARATSNGCYSRDDSYT